MNFDWWGVLYGMFYSMYHRNGPLEKWIKYDRVINNSDLDVNGKDKMDGSRKQSNDVKNINGIKLTAGYIITAGYTELKLKLGWTYPLGEWLINFDI